MKGLNVTYAQAIAIAIFREELFRLVQNFVSDTSLSKWLLFGAETNSFTVEL